MDQLTKQAAATAAMLTLCPHAAHADSGRLKLEISPLGIIDAERFNERHTVTAGPFYVDLTLYAREHLELWQGLLKDGVSVFPEANPDPDHLWELAE